MVHCTGSNAFKESMDVERRFDYFQPLFRIGPKWALIAQFLPGRSYNSIKNRWNSWISKRIERKLEKKNYEEKETGKQTKRKHQFKVARIDTKKQENQENQESSKLPICDPIQTQSDEEEGIDRSKSSIIPSNPEFSDFFCYLFDHPREGCALSQTGQRPNLEMFENLFPVGFFN
jgi:hypothetical protein